MLRYLVFSLLSESRLTPELTGRTFNKSSVEVLRMKAAPLRVRSNELLDAPLGIFKYFQ